VSVAVVAVREIDVRASRPVAGRLGFDDPDRRVGALHRDATLRVVESRVQHPYTLAGDRSQRAVILGPDRRDTPGQDLSADLVGGVRPVDLRVGGIEEPGVARATDGLRVPCVAGLDTGERLGQQPANEVDHCSE